MQCSTCFPSCRAACLAAGLAVAMMPSCSSDGDGPADAAGEQAPADVVRPDVAADSKPVEGCQQGVTCSVATGRDCYFEGPDCASSLACHCVNGKLECNSLLDRGGAIGRVWCADGVLPSPFECQVDAAQCCRCSAGVWSCGAVPTCN